MLSGRILGNCQYQVIKFKVDLVELRESSAFKKVESNSDIAFHIYDRLYIKGEYDQFGK